MPNASERAAAHNVGKYVRWPLLYQTEAPLIIAPIDDFLIFGPFAGLQNRRQRVKAMLGADIDTVLTFPGAIERNLDLFAQRHFVINLTASTTMNQHTRKTVVASVHRAVSLGASGVAAHINLTSQWASEMLDQAGMIVEEAAALGMPALGIVYPRGEIGETDNNFDDLKANDPLAYADMLAHCVSTGVDIGFDVIKTQFVGPSQILRTVVEAADGTPIVIAGGPPIPDRDLMERTLTAFEAGAAGVSYGRNFFGRQDLLPVIRDIRALYTRTKRNNHES